MFKIILKLLLAAILGFSCVTIIPPYIGGLYYACCGEHSEEQVWLNQCILRIKIWRDFTPDPELKDILNYTITRYNHIGPWDVMVMPLPCLPSQKVWGCNLPWCPGITIDTDVVHLPIYIGAHVLVHESLHDTYLGHDKITPIMARINAI